MLVFRSFVQMVSFLFRVRDLLTFMPPLHSGCVTCKPTLRGAYDCPRLSPSSLLSNRRPEEEEAARAPQQFELVIEGLDRMVEHILDEIRPEEEEAERAPEDFVCVIEGLDRMVEHILDEMWRTVYQQLADDNL
ncbi:hypothetical protein GDO78_022997 [Eleutherodactylus coqui]|uniref:Uncharacterized protein n=1 Tax=Eleutherodactylus coqui TaxID=57060 RepID=A0A8J6C4I3_ELECQ|nr:hypothetical protein GDO78_022997 [Eleutherodactylus coqui]